MCISEAGVYQLVFLYVYVDKIIIFLLGNPKREDQSEEWEGSITIRIDVREVCLRKEGD
jgi:hypothetical protein